MNEDWRRIIWELWVWERKTYYITITHSFIMLLLGFFSTGIYSTSASIFATMKKDKENQLVSKLAFVIVFHRSFRTLPGFRFVMGTMPLYLVSSESEVSSMFDFRFNNSWSRLCQSGLYFVFLSGKSTLRDEWIINLLNSILPLSRGLTRILSYDGWLYTLGVGHGLRLLDFFIGTVQ